MRRKVGSGKQTRFWLDCQLGEESLQSKGVFVWDFFGQKITFFIKKKLVFVCLNNFFKLIWFSKGSIFTSFVEVEKSNFFKKINFQFF